MLQAQSEDQVVRNATRIGENLRASLHHLVELVHTYNDNDGSEGYVDPAAVVSAAGIKFVKPTGTMIAGLMAQFNILLIQVIPSDPNHTLGHIMEQGYHVVPTALLQHWKQIILNAHGAAINEVLEMIAAEAAEDEEEQSETEEIMPSLTEIASAGAGTTAQEPSNGDEEV
jgi:hypothetical protein